MTLEQTLSILRQREVPYHEGCRGYRYVNYDEEGLHLANILELDRDEHKLYSAILSTFPPEDLLKKEEELSETDCAGLLLGKIHWAATDHPAITAIPQNEPIRTLLKLFKDKKSKCVSYARKSLQTRYPYQTFAIQKKILRTFLEDGAKEDISWAGRVLRNKWIQEFSPLVANKWMQTHNPMLAFTVIRHLPTSFIISEQETLATATSYAYVSARIGNEPGFMLDRTRLSVPDYFYVMAKLGRKMSEKEAMEELEAYLTPIPDIVYSLGGVSSEHDPQLTDIPGISIIVWALGKLGLTDSLLWLLGVKSVIQERFKEVTAEDRWPALTAVLRCLFNPELNPEKVFMEEKLKFIPNDADDDDLPPSTFPGLFDL